MLFLFVFFKQKTAYEMRISDWSSDVCSSDLARVLIVDPATGAIREAEPKGEAARAMRDAKRPGKVYSKWRYVPEVDAFFGITNVTLGFVLFRLDRSAAAPAPAVFHPVAADSPQHEPAPEASAGAQQEGTRQ